MEIINKTLDSILIRCHDIHVENIKYGELVVLVESDSDYNDCSCSSFSGRSDAEMDEFDGESGDIANESSVEDILEIVRQATIAKKEPTIYEIEFGNVSGTSGKCNFEDLVRFLHRLGLSPTKAQCEELKREFGTNNIDMESALRAYNKTSTDKYTKEELVTSLNSTSSNVNRKRLVILLQTFGDKMTEDEVNTALDKLGIGNEPIDKTEFVEKLCSGSKQVRTYGADSSKSRENLCGSSPDAAANNDQEEQAAETVSEVN